ncbi:MAG: BT_3987 domain-containing protein [Candidatus Cryptobacteroides sp.]
MKKKLLAYSLILAALVSCEDKRLDGLEPDKVYLPKAGLNVEESFTVGEDATFSLWAYKGSYNGTSCDVSFIVDQAVLDTYNQEHGTSYELLPEDSYTTSDKLVHFDGKQEHGKFYITYTPEKIVGLCSGEYGLEKYALPVRIASDDVEVTDASSAVIVFRVLEPVVKMLSDKVDVQYDYGAEGPVVKTVKFGMDFESKWECEYSIDTDQNALKALVDEYNEKNSTSFALMSPEAYSISAPEGKISIGAKSVSLDIEMDPSAVPSGRYIIPVSLKSVGSPLKISEQAKVCYVIVNCRGQYVDKSDWTLEVSSANPNYGKPAYLIDGDLNTYWHPAGRDFGQGRDDHPYAIVDMKKTVHVSCVEIAPRKDQFYPQIYSDLRVFVSDDGVEFTQIGYVAVPWTSVTTCVVYTEPAEGRFVKFSVEYPKGQTSIAFAELSVRGEVIE